MLRPVAIMKGIPSYIGKTLVAVTFISSMGCSITLDEDTLRDLVSVTIEDGDQDAIQEDSDEPKDGEGDVFPGDEDPCAPILEGAETLSPEEQEQLVVFYEECVASIREVTDEGKDEEQDGDIEQDPCAPILDGVEELSVEEQEATFAAYEECVTQVFDDRGEDPCADILAGAEELSEEELAQVIEAYEACSAG